MIRGKNLIQFAEIILVGDTFRGGPEGHVHNLSQFVPDGSLIAVADGIPDQQQPRMFPVQSIVRIGDGPLGAFPPPGRPGRLKLTIKLFDSNSRPCQKEQTGNNQSLFHAMTSFFKIQHLHNTGYHTPEKHVCQRVFPGPELRNFLPNLPPRLRRTAGHFQKIIFFPPERG